jgi:hypothetical protein
MVVSIGGPWPVLQSVAWMGMLIDYSREGSVTVAVAKTFDGQHPCPLCKAIAAGKKSETKKEFSQKLQKLEFPLFCESFAIAEPVLAQQFFQTDDSWNSTSDTPPTPPPRGFGLL